MINQKKFINNLTFRGKKETGEKILLKTIKNIQKKLSKQANEVIKFVILWSIFLFKIHLYKKPKKQKKKKKLFKIKEIPKPIKNFELQFSSAVRYLLTNARKNKPPISKNLSAEIIAIANKQKENLEIKKNTQKKVIEKVHILHYYK